MSEIQLYPREEITLKVESGIPHENISNFSTLRLSSQDDLGSIPSEKNRVLSPPGTNRKFSFLSAKSDIRADPSTRHTDTYSHTGYFRQLIPQSRRFAASDNLKFILNSCLWYMSSSLTNNVGKSIMIEFSLPVTLTFVQFFLVAFWCCFISIMFGKNRIRSPNTTVLKITAPLAAFLIVNHIFSSIAISEVPVSLVHTIKALAPLFTVLFYRFIFQVQYSNKVYTSLLPLTVGVILACSLTYSNNYIGLSSALGSCLVFVCQNIFSKKLLFTKPKLSEKNSNKLDKLNVLFYSSLLSCLMMLPLWLYLDGSELITYYQQQEGEREIPVMTLLFSLFINGTMNFAQNWFSFTTLSLTSPVTYSILSLLKRIFVIVMSILWFGQSVTGIQSVGILLTFIGLGMYQQAKSDVDKGETKLIEKSMHLLPIQRQPSESSWGTPTKNL